MQNEKNCIWEYKVVGYYTEDNDDLAQEQNRQGLEGWECYAVIPSIALLKDPCGTKMFFKRKK